MIKADPSPGVERHAITAGSVEGRYLVFFHVLKDMVGLPTM